MLVIVMMIRGKLAWLLFWKSDILEVKNINHRDDFSLRVRLERPPREVHAWPLPADSKHQKKSQKRGCAAVSSIEQVPNNLIYRQRSDIILTKIPEFFARVHF